MTHEILNAQRTDEKTHVCCSCGECFETRNRAQMLFVFGKHRRTAQKGRSQ